MTSWCTSPTSSEPTRSSAGCCVTAAECSSTRLFATDRLEPREAEWLWRTIGVVKTTADPARTDAAIAAAGLRVDARIDLASEWGEWSEENAGAVGRKLLHAARLLREPERYSAQFGQPAYEIMLGDCLWHVYAMIGKLERRVHLLTKT